jgi:hypothetical protein
MARWVSQAEVPSTTKTALGRVRYLDALIPRIDALIESYFQARPDGETVTIHVLTALGLGAVDAYAHGRTLDTVKQDLGRLIVIRMAKLNPPTSVFTYRQSDGRSPSARAAPVGAPDWVRSFTPHRLVLGGGVGERIVLDTNVVRGVLHGDEGKLDLAELAILRGRHPVSLADPAWAEIVAFLLRAPEHFEAWKRTTLVLDGILDPHLPIVPTGREAALFAGVLPLRGYDTKLAASYYRNVWRFTSAATSPGDFARVHEYEGPDGHVYAFGPLKAETVDAAFKRRIAAWQRFIERTMRAAPQSEEESLTFIREDLERELPPSAVDALDLYVRSIVRYGLDLRAQLKPDENDAVDLDILFTTVLPAWLCTGDVRLQNIAWRSGSADAWRVTGPAALIDRLRKEGSGESGS